MPIIKSAKKRVRVAAKAAVRNTRTKRELKSALKAFYSSLATKKTEKIASAHTLAVRALDIAVKKNVMHKNKAAHKKQQMALAINKAGIKPKYVKKVATKPLKAANSKKKLAKKPATKKSAAKASTKKASVK